MRSLDNSFLLPSSPHGSHTPTRAPGLLRTGSAQVTSPQSAAFRGVKLTLGLHNKRPLRMLLSDNPDCRGFICTPPHAQATPPVPPDQKEAIPRSLGLCFWF